MKEKEGKNKKDFKFSKCSSVLFLSLEYEPCHLHQSNSPFLEGTYNLSSKASDQLLWNTYQSTWDLFGKHISYLEWRKAVHNWWSHIARALVSVGPTCKCRLRFFSCISLGCGITYFVYHYNSILKSGNCGGDEIALRWYNQYFVVKWHLSIKYMEAQFSYCCLILF